jgi:hypothetical protein
MLSPSADTMIWLEYPDTNYGSVDWFGVGVETGYGTQRGLIKFPFLQNIPKGSKILSAKLRLYPAYYSKDVIGIKICFVTADWDELTVTWNTHSNKYSTDYVKVYYYSPSWSDFEIAPLVQKIVNGEVPDYGFMLIGDPENVDNGRVSFIAKEYYTVERRPYIEISYEPPEGVEGIAAFLKQYWIPLSIIGVIIATVISLILIFWRKK